MQSTGFCDRLGPDHFLMEDLAIGYLFYKMLDPAICIYECDVRAFQECQNLPKRTYPIDIPLHTDIPPDSIASISAQTLQERLRNGDTPPLVIDVREPREFKQGHIPYSQLVPLPKLLSETLDLPLPFDHDIVLVCRSGRRSTRAAYVLQNKGYRNVCILQGGILGWETAGYLEAVKFH
jgi:SulP family sulfate permease